MKRLALTSPLIVSLFILFGCPGSLENPDRFMRPGGGVTCTLGIDVETQLFATTCAGTSCHGDGINPGAGGIDLVKAGVAMRLLDKPSVGCAGHNLVDTGTIANSALLLRVGGQSVCGTPMPLGTQGLSQEQQDCIEAWIIDEIMSSTVSGAM